MKNELIPNSFQTPNAYVDDFMAFLTPEEYKVLSYAIRRIIGFDKRQDHISLSQFTDGAILSDGQVRDYGTGLGREAVRNALDGLIRFNLLVKVADNDKKVNKGPLYAIQLDYSKVDYEGLIERASAKKSDQLERTQAASAVRHQNKEDTPYVGRTTPGTSDVPPPVRPTDHPPYVPQTTPRTSDVHTKSRLNQVLNPEEKEILQIQNSNSPATPQSIWDFISGQIAVSSSRGFYTSWIEPASPISLVDGLLKIGVANQHAQELLQSRIGPTCNRIIRGLVNSPGARVEFVIREPAVMKAGVR